MVNLHSFKSYLIEKDQEHFEILLKYEAFYGEIPVSFEDSAIYKEYVSRFDYDIQYRHPVDESEKFDWKIFLQLVAASDTTEYSLVVNSDGTVDLIIFYEVGINLIPEIVNNFSMRTINGLFTIFLNEQIRRFVLINDSDFWKGIFITTHNNRVDMFMNNKVPLLRQDLKSFEIMKKFRKSLDQ